MDILVGNTGFVGSNLVRQHSFDAVFNSKTIQNAYDLCPDLCVYAGIRAEKYLANQAPDKDFALCISMYPTLPIPFHCSTLDKP